MSHFAKVENGIVTQVIVIEQDTINTGAFGDPSLWVQTSYNTRGNQNLLGGTPIGGNFAGVGHVYDSVNKVFYEPQPYPSWSLNTTTWTWMPPVAMPIDENRYAWDEATLSWTKE